MKSATSYKDTEIPKYVKMKTLVYVLYVPYLLVWIDFYYKYFELNEKKHLVFPLASYYRISSVTIVFEPYDIEFILG